ncbi:aspartate/glutamate racemase family protein [Neptunicoccus cionae]|uniref:Asp/Glu/hydantoin racemase n=1 Tax=Neptunicoccus cionae TaxID=2035344 RepID=A0A916R1C1_9RHOB|nr:aspartate/glutamate racemase family protein [Amylibacter cionae]GGA26557.1 Asp/Glu/hydantoin racemase [Amylibacter cionae]
MPPHLLVVNPNGTAEMTDRIGAEARQHLPAGITMSTRTNPSGPPSIQGAADGAEALPGTLRILQETTFDLALIACFDDTGLTETTRQRVFGIGQAAMQTAHDLGQPFAVLTTSELSVPVLEANAKVYGLTDRLICIRASTIAVLDFEQQRESANKRLIAAARRLVEDHPEIRTIVLGCAGMGGLAVEMEQQLNLQVIDPIKAAVVKAVTSLTVPTPSLH